MKRRIWLLAVLGGMLLTLGCSPAPESAAGGGALYQRTLASLDGAPVTMSAYQGKPVLVNFWATWCAPCVKEMPDLDALQAEFPGVSFVGIGVDSAANLREFVQRVPVRYDLYEAQSSGLDIMRDLGSTSGGLPYTVLIEPNGRIMQAISGQITKESLRPLLTRLAAAG